MTSLIDAESVLTVDVGSVNTRVLLFDVVDGQYHFISAASAPSTAGVPFRDIGEGFHLAVQRLQEITGRIFIDTEYNLILPSQSDGSGVDRLAVTFSVGDDINIVTMGLLADVSLESADRLAGMTYGRVVERVGLNDPRRPDAQLDAMIQARPDIIIVAGGTEKGATRSVFKMIELAGLACRVMPKETRPVVIYCGNGALSKRVKETLEREIVVGIAPNIRPNIDQEDLDPAGTLLARAVAKIRSKQISGLEPLASLSAVPLTPGAQAFGRMIRFLSDIYDPHKGVLGIDLGASTTTLAIGRAGSLQLSVSRPLGMGAPLPVILQGGRMENVMQWIPQAVTESSLRDYVYQKSIRPGSLPLTPETLAMEQAAARAVLSLAMQRMQDRWPVANLSFDLVVAGGAVLAQAASPAQSLLLILDGVQPVGVGVFLLDPYGLTQSLGAISAHNTVLPVQVKDAGVYLNLGTVISPISEARHGTVILKIHVKLEDGSDHRVEVKQGSLVSLPIRSGQSATLSIETLHGTILDPVRPRMKSFKVIGGACGVVIDARGRPIRLAEDAARRREQLVHWAHALEDRRMV
jgi:hypothetical protein